jgi:secretion/DNA translocation related TadE-like protein
VTGGRWRGSERGAATVLVIGVVAVGLSLTAGAARLGGALVAKARADTAADAAALAAADMVALGRGADAAERAARETAATNDGRLLRCECGGPVVEVEVAVDAPGLAGLGGTARAEARAEVRFDCAFGAACDEEE